MGAFIHVLENLTLYCAIVGVMGCVSMCLFNVLVRTFCNSCGVYRLFVGFDWLYMQIIDVIVGFMYW